MGLIGKIVGEKAGEIVGKNAANSFGKIAGKVYAKTAEIATEKAVETTGKITKYAAEKVSTKIDESNNEKVKNGTRNWFLTQNPGNAKLVLQYEKTNAGRELRIMDRNQKEQYIIKESVFGNRRWNVYDVRKKKIAAVREKRITLRRLLQRGTDPRDFMIIYSGKKLGTVKTVYRDEERKGTTDFNDWQIDDEHIYAGGCRLSGLNRTSLRMAREYVLDSAKDVDQLVAVLVFFAIKMADMRA